MPDIPYGGARRGSGRLLLRGVLVLLIAAAAAACAGRQRLAEYFSPKPGPAPLREGLIEILVPASRVPAYTRIQPGMLKRIPKARSTVEGRDILIEGKDILYRVPVVDLEPEAPVREDLLAPRGTRPGLSSGIPSGWAAVTMAEEGVDGQVTQLQAGDEVAVLAVWTSKEMPSISPARSTWVSRRARVLIPLRDRVISTSPAAAMSPARAAPARGAKVVHELTIAMPQDDLVAYARAQGRAKIQLVLLSSVDKEERGAKAPTRDPESPVWQVELIQGGKRELVFPSWWRPEEPDDRAR
jgi:Flp pilus assembly protein CpaB